MRELLKGLVFNVSHSLLQPHMVGVLEMSHETHCNQGEYEGSCKYGEASTCPMLKEPTPQEPDGSVPGGTATPAGCGPLEPVAWEGAEDWECLAYELCAEEHGEESCNDLLWEGGAIPEPWGDRWLKYEGEAKRMIALVTKYHSADTIAALQSLVGEDKLALGKQLAQSNAERQQLQEAVAALQAENAELLDRLQARADNAYCDYIGLCRRDECLGWEAKVEKGLFGEAELKAHKEAAERLGRHRALQEAANLLHELLTPNAEITGRASGPG